jgi:hypothetical protein
MRVDYRGWEVQARTVAMEQRVGGGMIPMSRLLEPTAILRKAAVGIGTGLISKAGSGDGVVSVFMTSINMSCTGRGEVWV